MAEQKKPEPTRIAIKFGSAPSSTTKKPAWPAPSSALGKRSRASRGLGGDESESEDESRATGRQEHITGFGANGAELDKRERKENSRAKRGPLVIEKQANRDWRADARARRQKQAQRPTGSTNEGGKDTELADQDKPIKWGLSITKGGEGTKPDTDDARASKEATRKDGNAEAAAETKILGGNTGGEDGQDPAKDAGDVRDVRDVRDAKDNLDKEAVDALLGRTIDDRTKTRLVIEGTANSAAPSEDDVFHRDFHDAPDTSTLEEYEAMPVEEFGAALLRGMGWDGKDRGPKVKQVKRRPNQMGLGAKELKGDEELGAWNAKGVSSHRQRPPRLHEYRREQEKRREKHDDRYRDSYKAEREREREQERDHRYGGGGGSSSSSSSRYRDRHRR